MVRAAILIKMGLTAAKKFPAAELYCRICRLTPTLGRCKLLKRGSNSPLSHPNSHPDDISSQAQPSLLSAHLSSSILIILIALCLQANSQTVVTSHHLLRPYWLVSGSLSELLSGIFRGAAPLVFSQARGPVTSRYSIKRSRLRLCGVC